MISVCVLDESKGLIKIPRLLVPKSVSVPRDLRPPPLGDTRPCADSALPVRVMEPYKPEEFLKLEDGSGNSESDRTRSGEEM